MMASWLAGWLDGWMDGWMDGGLVGCSPPAGASGVKATMLRWA